MSGSKPANFEVNFSNTQPHPIQIFYSHSGDRAGGGLTLKWEAPSQVQIDEAVKAAKQSDVVVAFVGLSPQLEGEEMPIKIEGFNGGDRTNIDLPASQRRMLEAVAATGKPVVVVSLSGSALALTWAKEHANAVIQAWYPGVEGGTAIARTLAGLNNPAGRLPVTFYSGIQDLPQFTDYSMKNRTYRYYAGKPLWGFGYGLSYTTFSYGPVKLSKPSIDVGSTITATVTVKNVGGREGDEVVEAYLKTPQPNGPVRTLVGFNRVHLNPGQQRDISFELTARSLSSVEDSGQRSVLPGTYHLMLGGAQPGQSAETREAAFVVSGSAVVPK